MNLSRILTSLQTGGSPADRMSFAVFMATALHLLLLFGIGFSLPASAPLTPSLDVVLATHFSAQAPERADFLGQANQLGGGDSNRATPPRSGSQSPMPSPDANAAMDTPEGAAQTELASRRTLLASRSDQRADSSDAHKDSSPDVQAIASASIVERSLAIASLSAELSEQQELEARAPRKKLIAASIVSSTEAPYFDSWRRRIEKVGRNYFPDGIGIAQELIMRADINADGSLREVVIIQSSGNPKVDHAAREIVHRAQPFPPFTATMRSQYDVLQIVRLWRFEPGGNLRTEAR